MRNAYIEAVAYIRRIRHQPKRQYAEQYLAYITGQIPTAPIYHGSYMAAQGVRLRLECLGQVEIPQCQEDLPQAAQRRVNQPLRPSKPQIPCDEGLFSNTKDQLDLADMPMFQD